MCEGFVRDYKSVTKYNYSQALELCQVKEVTQRWARDGIAGKKVKVMWGGDLLFLSELMGHSTGSSSYPCIYCKQ